MISLDPLFKNGGQWLSRILDKLESLVFHAPDRQQGAEESRWSRRSFFITLSVRGQALAKAFHGALATIQKRAENDLELYSEKGKSRFWPIRHEGVISPQKSVSAWPHAAFRVSFSLTGRLANGISTHMEADSAMRQTFIDQMQSQRRLGYLNTHIFHEVRILMQEDAFVQKQIES